MATYYVGSGGSDAAAGTSWGARWLTIGKALGAAGIASGDTVYLAPGTYREVVTVAMASATAETLVIGDVDGSHTNGAPGEVVWTAYTTNDTTAPSASTLLTIGTNDYLTFRNITFVGGSGNPAVVSVSDGGTNLTFTDCCFISTFASSLCTVSMSANAAITFDRCGFLGRGGAPIRVQPTRNGTADFDTGVLVQNCFLQSSANGVTIASTGAGTKFGGGVDILNCTIIGNNCVATNDANIATSIPSTVNNCILVGNTTGLSANTSGQITESYCWISATTARTNVTAGTGSIADNSYAFLIELGQAVQRGASRRPFMSPMVGSPLLGFGGASPPTVDLLNRPRPAGGASTSVAVGAYERHDTAAKETSVTDAGGVGIKITGPGDHDFRVPVNAASTTITVRCRYDSNHNTTNKPQAILLANGEIGVTTETKTATAAVDTWETLTFSAFTPSAKGVVTVRLVSRSAAGNGIAYFDTLTAS